MWSDFLASVALRKRQPIQRGRGTGQGCPTLLHPGLPQEQQRLESRRAQTNRKTAFDHREPACCYSGPYQVQRQMPGAQEHQAEPSRSVLEAFLFTLLLRSFCPCQVLSCLSSSFPKSPEGHALPSQQTSARKHSSLGSCCLHTRLCWLFCLKLATSGLISAQTHH